MANGATTGGADPFHAATFYETSESLCRIVAEFLGDGLRAQQPALAIVTPEHRAGIVAELRARQIDVDAAQEAGDFLVVDVDEALASFIVDSIPDAGLFLACTTRAIEQLRRGRKDCTMRAYGELVDVLWKAGQDSAAIRVELLWNKLADDFSLLCGYAMGNFYKRAGLSAISQEHSRVVSPDEALPSVTNAQ